MWALTATSYCSHRFVSIQHAIACLYEVVGGRGVEWLPVSTFTSLSDLGPVI